MPTEATREFEQAWAELHPAFRRGLELAYQSLAGGGLACGAALTDAGDRIVAEGRNRAYDDPGGPDPLQGTPLAHAELNLLALVRTGWDLGPCTLWSTQEPCSMCAMAASFTGVGQVRYLAPDPWALATQPQDRRLAASAATERSIGPADDDRWVVSANVLFLHSVASRSGLTHTTVARNSGTGTGDDRHRRRPDVRGAHGGSADPWAAADRRPVAAVESHHRRRHRHRSDTAEEPVDAGPAATDRSGTAEAEQSRNRGWLLSRPGPPGRAGRGARGRRGCRWRRSCRP
jgi:tRNA(Arg) A34 adenosine deaminase TadA